MAGSIEISLEGVDVLAADLGVALSDDVMRRMNREVSFALVELLADHIGRASKSRHKTAERLHARKTGFLEFAPGRASSVSRAGGEIVPGSTENEASAAVLNTPGLRRAFGPLDIVAHGKPLTIPIHAVSYARRVGELRNEGWTIFQPRAPKNGGERKRVLFGTRGSGRSRETIPLYVLAGHAHIPQDTGLLPSTRKVENAARDVAEAFIETEAL